MTNIGAEIQTTEKVAVLRLGSGLGLHIGKDACGEKAAE